VAILENFFGAEEVDESLEVHAANAAFLANYDEYAPIGSLSLLYDSAVADPRAIYAAVPGLKYLLPGVFSFDQIYSS
jgi:hypothetical protein